MQACKAHVGNDVTHILEYFTLFGIKGAKAVKKNKIVYLGPRPR